MATNEPWNATAQTVARHIRDLARRYAQADAYTPPASARAIVDGVLLQYSTQQDLPYELRNRAKDVRVQIRSAIDSDRAEGPLAALEVMAANLDLRLAGVELRDVDKKNDDAERRFDAVRAEEDESARAGEQREKLAALLLENPVTQLIDRLSRAYNLQAKVVTALKVAAAVVIVAGVVIVGARVARAVR